MPVSTQPLAETLQESNKEWNTKFTQSSDNKQLLQNISHKQTPDFLLLSCIDSRYNDTVLNFNFGTCLKYNSIGNVLDLKKNNSILAILDFAIIGLNIKKIIILGHTDCGGIKAALKFNDSQALSCSFDSEITQLKELVHNSKSDNEDIIAAENVTIQSNKLNDFLQQRYTQYDVDVIGLMYNVGTGLVEPVA